MSINDRILKIIHHYNLNKNSFSLKIGLTNGVAIGNIVGGRKNKPSYAVLEKILETFPVDANWLITGKGRMLSDNDNDSMQGIEDVRKLLEAKDKIIALQEEKIKELKSENDIHVIAENISVQNQKIIDYFERQITGEALEKAKQRIDNDIKNVKKG